MEWLRRRPATWPALRGELRRGVAGFQTLDQGAPVSVFTVAREMGHGGDSMVRLVYGHLGTVRHRAEVVEYRIEQHAPVAGAPAGGYVPHPEHL